MFVRYKNYNWNYEEESKRKFIEINADRFNPEYHERLFWRNFYQDHIKGKGKDFFHNPWVVGIGTGVIAGIILFLLLG